MELTKGNNPTSSFVSLFVHEVKLTVPAQAHDAALRNVVSLCSAGNTVRAEHKVSVPLSQNGNPAVQDATAFTVTSSCL